MKPLKTHKLTFCKILAVGHGGIPFWEFGGNAMITDESVQLTDAQQSRKGWIWNTQVRI